MIFSTYSFIFAFLPAVFFSYSLALGTGRVTLSKIILIISSFFFYAYGSGSFFPFFVTSIFFNYYLGMALSHVKETKKETRLKLVLILGIAANLSLLFYFKYTDFYIYNVNLVFDSEIPYKNIILPIGISFFTFQLIAYLVDSYRGETKGYGLINYLMFITFFPQLIVGPIVHHKDVVPQYQSIKRALPSYKNIAKGSFLFFLGSTKKLLMADPLSEVAQKAFDHAQSLNMVESWFASISYTLSYYFDLSGYADMALGLGIIFGILLPMNFNSPYKARNFADYWRRWHITLSKFLGDYIFRNIFNKNKGELNFYFAIFITFLVSGFWHGAGWTFVVWGIINGIFVIASHMMIKAKISLPFVIAWALTFLGIVGTRILFVSNDFSDATHVLMQLINFAEPLSLTNTYTSIKQPFYIVIGMIIVLFFPNSGKILEKFKPNYKFMMVTAVLVTASLLNMSYVRGFLYFQF